MPGRIVATLVAALSLATSGCAEEADRRPEAPVESPAVGAFRSDRTYQAVPVPVRLRIPQLRVDTPLQRLGRAADGTIAVPSKASVAGWYAEGPRPGQAGPAVILGHVDWAGGPAVFFRLADLRPGAVVQVVREGGSVMAFRVTGLSQVPKASFPTDLVYSPTLQPALRLVTCGGSYDRKTRNYRDNVIVHAVPA